MAEMTGDPHDAEAAARAWPRFDGRRAIVVGAVLAVAGLGITAIAVALDPRRALLGYVAAYAAVAAAAMGALVLQLAGYVANARWPAPLRRLNESLTVVFPVLAVLFVPIALGVDWIYAWADPSVSTIELTAHDRHAIDAKRAWLNPAGFIVRGFVYLAIFTLAAERLRAWSRARDGRVAVAAAFGEAELARERRFAAALLPFVGLALTFAAFDWVMSLQPAWFSSMFGFYYFAGGFGAGLALMVILAWQGWERRQPETLPAPIARPHFHALGRLMFGFVVFWAYTSYFQGFLIQIANRPNEVTFFIARTTGGWYGLLVVVLAVHFALPFFLLLPRHLKLRPRYLSVVAGIVLLGHLLDTWWVVLPSHGGPLRFHVADLAAVVGIAGACVAWSAWRQRGVPVVASGDPFVEAGIRYESPT